MPPLPEAPSLDDTVQGVHERLVERGVPAPEALFLLATGTDALADVLENAHEVELGEVEDVPAPWDGAVLHAGELQGLRLWALADVGGDPSAEACGPAWVSALPVWLAARAGAVLCLHASAGSALPDARVAVPAGGFALLSDHLNLSGRSPLLGVGESRLGPLFPDQSRVHHLGLRRAALHLAETRGHVAAEAVAACVAGPALETPSERRMLARLGADVAVQSLASPLVACAHAGLACLALVAITDAGEAPADVARLVERAVETAPVLEGFLVALVPDLIEAARVLREEEA
jgi:purine-nucleoside phosphorylase